MAITNAQQARQLYQFGGGADAGGKGSPGGGDFGGGGNSGGNGDTRSDRMGSLGKKGPPGGLSDKSRGDLEAMAKGLRSSIAAQNRAAAFGNFKTGLKNIFDKTLIGRGINMLGKAFGPKDLGIRGGYNMANIAGPTTTEEEDEQGQGGEDNVYVPPTFAQTQAPAGLPAAVQPMQTMDLNRIAYRLMADGGFLGEEDEPRQAYGLGSLVKKVVKKATTLPRKLVKTVKKVAKSPTGRLLLAVAAPYALGPAMAGNAAFLGSLSAAQKAALVSGATTGITQLASGEDLDLKDIALSAAIGGGTAKMFPGNIPGKQVPQGVSGSNKALFTSDAAMRGTGFGAGDALGGEMLTGGATQVSSIIPKAKPIVDAGTKSTGILQSLKNIGTKVTDSKLGNLLIGDGEGGISPMKSILLASGLSGLAAKKDYEEDEFSEMDRGEGIDIAAIRRRPFEYMAPRFAGSRFNFYDTAAANGGRIGYQEAGAVLSEKEMKKLAKSALYKGFKKMYSVDPQMAKDNPAYEGKFDMFKKIYDQKFQKGGKAEPVAKKVMPLLDMGGQEMDLRAEGGFVPIGRMEKADDVPARLSKNEFVFTAEAVRNAGEGDVDKGAEVMYNMMKNLEAGGDVSEESQGLKGARRMFQTSQRLEEVL